MGSDKSNGIHIGKVGGDVSLTAGGDIVAGDKTTHTQVGFQDQANKDQLLGQLEELRSALRELKGQVENAPQLDQDAKDQLVVEILQQVSSLKQAREDAQQVEPGPLTPGHAAAVQLESVGQCLDKAGGLLDKVKSLGEAAAGLAGSLAPVLARAVPIVLSARHLLGIP
jgi:hypothetical protein